MGIFSRIKDGVKSIFKKTATAVSTSILVVSTVALPAISHGADATTITPEQITGSVTGIGMPALIGAAVAVMLGISALIWGGKKIIGFFTK